MLADSKVLDSVIEYLERLPAELGSKYGGSGLRGYTESQIRKAIDTAELSNAHIRYAIAIFGDKDAHCSMNINSAELNELMDQLHVAAAERKLPWSDKAVLKIVEFLEKAGNISDGAGGG